MECILGCVGVASACCTLGGLSLQIRDFLHKRGVRCRLAAASWCRHLLELLGLGCGCADREGDAAANGAEDGSARSGTTEGIDGVLGADRRRSWLQWCRSGRCGEAWRHCWAVSSLRACRNPSAEGLTPQSKGEVQRPVLARRLSRYVRGACLVEALELTLELPNPATQPLPYA